MSHGSDVLELLFGLPAERFRREHWPDRPCAHAGPRERCDALLGGKIELGDALAFARAHRGRAWVQRRGPEGVPDHEVFVDGGEAAAAAFLAGHAMDLRDVQTWLPAAADVLGRLESELGIGGLVQSSYCHAFLSPRGTGAALHFDNREVFVVQLRGRKRWRLAPNDSLRAPLMPHVAGGPVHALNDGARGAIAPFTLPTDAEMRELRPGSALFIPRGTWHETVALEDSLSLSFGVRVPSWAELFVQAVSRELAGHAAWRAPAHDVTGQRRGEAEAFVVALRAALDHLRASAPPGAEG